MIDFHCHILPGIDDGPQTVDESLEMAKLLSEAGFTEIYCTPHCMKGVHDNTPAAVNRAVSDLQEKINEAGIPIRLHPGMEYYLDEYFPEYLNNHPSPLGNTNFLLVEASVHESESQLREHLFKISRKKLIPLLAHPERSPLFEQKSSFPGRIKSLFKPSTFQPSTFNPCLLQGNLGSLAGLYGKKIQKTASRLQKSGSYHCLGTDAHSTEFLFEIFKIKNSNLKP